MLSSAINSSTVFPLLCDVSGSVLDIGVHQYVIGDAKISISRLIYDSGLYLFKGAG